MSSSRAAAIAARLEEVLGEPLEGEARRLSSGASRETWALSTSGQGDLIAQLARGAGSFGTGAEEAPLLEAAAEAGTPVAPVVAAGADDPVLGRRWTVVGALPGSADPESILAEGAVADPAALFDSIAAALAAIHRVPADAPEIADPLAFIRGLDEQLGQPHPTFELAFRELERWRPASDRRALVHGDFRLGNLLVDGGRLSGVLDWELAHLGDPIEDLGWLCVRAWRFSRPDRPAAGLGSREDLLAAYERHSGVAVDPETLRWWELFGTLRWGVICVLQAFRHLGGSIRSLEHAVIGRRACEVEWDLLELLDPGGGAAGGPRVESGPGADAGSLHDRPTAVELLAAAREELGTDLLPQLEGRRAFQLRVALRALGVVERELERWPEQAALRDEVLEDLGAEDEPALAEAVRGGEYDGRRDELVAGLRALVRAKLEVANPRYLGPA